MKYVKYLLGTTLLLLVLTLIGATIAEKLFDTAFVAAHIYGAWWFVVLWALVVVWGLVWIGKKRLWKFRTTFVLHLSFVLILAGALVTHFFGVQGSLYLRLNQPNAYFMARSGEWMQIPFQVTLKSFQVAYYPGTQAPMDFISHIEMSDNGQSVEGTVSMNQICKHRNYRFYQSNYDEDEQGVLLSVAYDPVGIGLTYAGYLLLLVSMLAFFFDKHSGFRRLLHHPLLRGQAAWLIGGVCLVLASCDPRPVTPLPKTVPEDVAEAFGQVQVLYHDRICPVRTVARDFTTKLYGKDTYRGLTSEQVLMGWLFYFDSWKREPMIRIKEQKVRDCLGITGGYATLLDFAARQDGYKLDGALRQLRAGHQVDQSRAFEAANEKFNLVSAVCMGTFLKIFPVRESQRERLVWYGAADELPAGLAGDRWLFIRKYSSLLGEQIALARWDESKRLIEKLVLYQQKEAGDAYPSDFYRQAEQLYHTLHFTRPLAMLCLTLGIVGFGVYAWAMGRNRRPKRLFVALLTGIQCALFVYLSVLLVLRGLVSGHLPLSNGFETMQFMAWASLFLVFFLRKRLSLVLPFGLMLCGLTLLVAMLGEANPPITPLMPVLASPLLSIHVVIIMTAYSLLAFILLNGVMALVLHTHTLVVERLQVLSRLLLYPAVCLLAAGIFIGAVWANQSWGRYWGWDPKEVWALITLLVYAFALHQGSVPAFRRPIFFHIYMVLAFLSVIVTYFGVNFFLGGMHSYANG